MPDFDDAHPGVAGAHAGLDSPHAWRMAVAAFFACFVIFGVVYSFGAFFKPMAAQFGADRAQTSAVFSITACIYNLLGFAGGHLADRFGPRRVLLTGALAMGLGLVATSLIDRLWIGYLTYGLGIGIGVGCTYVPVLAMVGGWFDRRRTTALGLAVSGVGGGTLVVAPIAAALIVHFGWRESYVIMGLASTLMLAACAMLIEAPPVHTTTAVTPITLTRAMRSPDFLMLYVAMVLVSVSIYIPFVYLPDFAHSRGVSSVSAAALVGFIGASSVVGRLGLGSVAVRTGIIPLYRTSTLILGLSFGLWIVSRSYPVMVVFTIVMGLAYGGMIALSPAVVAELFGVRGLGAMLGALYTSSAISALTGPPLAGFVIDRTGSYLWAAGLAGATGVIGFLVLLPLGRTHETIAAAAEAG
jgi:MFS family permease